MSHTPAPRHPFPPITITPFSDLCCGFQIASSISIGSATWPVAAKAIFWPIRPLEPITVAKLFWGNGATATGNIDIGVYRMDDLSTGRLELIRSTGSIAQTGTDILQASATWKIAANGTSKTTGNDSTDRSSGPGYTTASVTLRTGRLYLLSFVNTAASAAAASAITGGPTWTSRSSVQYNGTAHRVSIWSAVPTSDYTGTLDIAFGATQTGCAWTLDEFSGVDTSSSDGIVQQATGTGSSTTLLATLGAFGSTSNATFGAMSDTTDATITAGSGFTTLGIGSATTPSQVITSQWRVTNDTTVDGTITSAPWGVCALELKADTSSLVIPPWPAHSYVGLSCSSTSSTIHRQVPNTNFGSASGLLEAATAFPLPPSVTPTASTVNYIPLAGVSLRTLLD